MTAKATGRSMIGFFALLKTELNTAAVAEPAWKKPVQRSFLINRDYPSKVKD